VPWCVVVQSEIGSQLGVYATAVAGIKLVSANFPALNCRRRRSFSRRQHQITDRIDARRPALAPGVTDALRLTRVRPGHASVRLTAALLVLLIASRVEAQLSLAPCTIPEVSGEARCGTFRVFEDRAKGTGRQIDLNLVVLTAEGLPRQPDPLFVLQGGPGQGVAQLADFYGRVFAAVRRTRDIILVDLRGTGKSNVLSCPQFAAGDGNGQLNDSLLDASAVQTCRQSLEGRADLTKYTTEIAVADLDAVRAALGYSQINLYGTSYGTYAALTYIRDFPARVRTVSMKGVVPHGQIAPIFHARDGQLAWEALVARCAAEPSCRSAYPTLATDLSDTVARLTRQPEQLTVKTAAGSLVAITLSAGLFGEVIRNMLYTPENAARLPSTVRQAAAGDWSTLGPLALRTRNALGGTDLSAGFFLSVTCGEGLPYVSTAQIAEMTSGTFGGDYRLQQQRAACEQWPRAAVSKRHGMPIASEVPVLMLSGALDPVTPPTRAVEAMRHLSRATHVVAANNGHPFGRLEGCGNLLIAQFIDKGTMEGIDTSCAKALAAVPFVLPDKK